jgi:threonine dehydrogenase-like Zn-dependent dehydrogenase
VKGVTFHGPGHVRVEEVPDPEIRDPGDVLLRVGRTAVCGSDLHVYEGRIPGVLPGSVVGHEYVGEVLEVGDDVRRFAPGDRVVGAFHVACGRCPTCRDGHEHQCQRGGIFGYGVAFGELTGAQAELLRVPWGDVNLRELPEGVTGEEALFAGDVLSTAHGAVRKADLAVGETCAVVGCGPVGLLAVQCALLAGASEVYAIDLVESRAEAAAGLGAVPVHSGPVNPVSRVQELTDGRGADVVVEAVGGPETLRLAFDLVRDAGRISAVGVTAEESFDFPLMSALVRDLEFRIGVANVHREIGVALRLLQSGRVDVSGLVSHRMPLEEAPEAYRLFAEREATKVVLEP